MSKSELYENNAGGLNVIVYKNDVVTNIIGGFEDGKITASQFIEAALEDFYFADDFEPENYMGLSINEVAEEIKNNDELVAEITDDYITLYTRNMGYAAKSLFSFGIKRY